MAKLSLDMLFPNTTDKENALTAFAAMGHDINDPYKDLTTEEKEAMNEKLQLIGQKTIIELDNYVATTPPISPDLSSISTTSTQVKVVKKFANHNIDDIINASELSNLEFLLKFNIVNPI
jgi:hypothetical protein